MRGRSLESITDLKANAKGRLRSRPLVYRQNLTFAHASQGARVVIPSLHLKTEDKVCFLFVGQPKREIAAIVQIHQCFISDPWNIKGVILDRVCLADAPKLPLAIVLILDHGLPGILINEENALGVNMT